MSDPEQLVQRIRSLEDDLECLLRALDMKDYIQGDVLTNEHVLKFAFERLHRERVNARAVLQGGSQ